MFRSFVTRALPWLLVFVAPSFSSCQKRSGARSGDSAASPVERPKGPLSLEDANAYVLALVNEDRAEQGLSPVEWDETAAKAAQRHVEDMCSKGYTGHWGTDGSVPEQRYTEAGGRHFVHENAAGLFDGEARELDPDPVFDPTLLWKIEEVFITEVPPNDGHKRNILKPWHNRVGIGIAKPKGVTQPCLVQEFVDEYGDYDELPREARVRQTITVSGEVTEPMRFGAIGISRIDPAEPIAVEELLTRSSYPVPNPYTMFSPPGFKTPKPVQVVGKRFSIDVALDDRGKPGRYEISVWAQFPDAPKNTLDMVSLRTVIVR